MEVRPGYKWTEMGVLPSEWSVSTFGTLYAEPSRNGIYKTAEYQGRGTRIVNMGEMFGFEFISNQEMNRVSLTPKEIATTGLFDGDLLFGRRSVVPAGAGKCSIVVNPPEPLTFESSIIRVRLDQSKAIPFFYYYFFASSVGRVVMSVIISGTNVKGIRATELRELKVPHPDPAEQRVIAAALSDVDALLGELERLIAKKRDIKQAAMQQLLTGQTRLPGFQGEWAVKRLEELAEIVSGGTPKTAEPAYWNGGIKWCTPTDITGCAGKYLLDTERTISRLGLNSSGARLLPAGALLLCSRATIGELKIASEKICTNQGFKSLICKPEVSNEFLYYKLLTMKQQMIERAFGSTFLEISKANVAALEILVPPVTEQSAIATALSDMDAELSALEARRDKTRALKQAMMQELLTGKTRLVPPSSNVVGTDTP